MAEFKFLEKEIILVGPGNQKNVWEDNSNLGRKLRGRNKQTKPFTKVTFANQKSSQYFSPFFRVSV